MFEQNLDPQAVNHTFVLISTIFLDLARNLKQSFNQNWMLIIALVVATIPICHKRDMTPCTYIFKTRNTNWNN